MPPNSPLQLQFSHIGLYVTDLDRMAGFYKRALRFTQTDAGDLGPVQLVFTGPGGRRHGRPTASPSR